MDDTKRINRGKRIRIGTFSKVFKIPFSMDPVSLRCAVLRFLLPWLLYGAFLSPLAGQTVYTPETIPDPKQAGAGYVSDPDGIISPADEATLNALITALEDSATAQIAVVLVQSIGQEDPKDFATRLFARWGIGQAGADNGLLIFSVMDQRRTEFETGYGLEGVLPDAICYRIGMQELVPYFRAGDYGQGLIAVVRRFKSVLENPEAAAEIAVPREPSQSGDPLAFLGLLVLGWHLLGTLLVLGWIAYTMRNKEDLYDRYLDLRKSYHFAYFFILPLTYAFLYFFLRRQLRILREHPRYSKLNGQPMRRLSEQEEDPYLEKGQVTEEEIGAVDYDVWITGDGEGMLILRYTRRFSRYQACPECGYRTFYHAHTRVVKQPTYREKGLREQVHLCKNCGYNRTEHTAIPRKQKAAAGVAGAGAIRGGGSRSRGSSSWGGGRSGGGGAGVSW